MKSWHGPSRYISTKSAKCYTFSALIFLLLLIFYYTIRPVKHTMPHQPPSTVFAEFKHVQEKFSFNGAKIVHLDLKGAPPKISYYRTLFPLLAKLGATGVLMEYEDMFPYQSAMVKNLSALNAYSLADIAMINKLAIVNKLDVIPLVQTFGHLEFLLKLDEYKEMREVSDYPQVICPTHEQTVDLLMDLIEQIMKAHPQSKFLHIGADEVYYLGFCDRCTSTMSRLNLSKNMLFLEHINALSERIHKRYPHVSILMWDDEFRSFTLKELKSTSLGKNIQPVIWKYTKDVYEELGPSLWDMYSEVFPSVWAASAFKGATGSNQYVSDVTHYVQNHRSWLSVINEYKSYVNFKGIIITGWQRYDHFAILCELLPVSLPSLAMSLRVLNGFDDSPLSPPTEVAKILGCEQPYALIGPVFGSPRCSYLGSEILENVLRLQQLKQEFETILEDSRVKGWMNDFNKAHAFSNPQHVQSVTAPLDRIRGELTQITEDIGEAMGLIYDQYTVTEWRESYIKPFQTEIVMMIQARDSMLAKEVWPRRPITEL